jgi:competence protein ComGD
VVPNEMDEKGFTLTEMLVVLSIFLVISSISPVLLKSHYNHLDKNLFFSQFRSDFFYAQQYAISHQSIIIVNIVSDQSYYYFRERINGPIILERKYPEEVKVTPGSMPLYFHILPNGNISSFGSFYAKVNKERYRFTFLIGKGRFYVAKD